MSSDLIYQDAGRLTFRSGSPTHGGAYAAYNIVAEEADNDRSGRIIAQVQFQDAPIPEVGVKGLTNECCLAMVIDRLQCFQEGPTPCEENEEALILLRSALKALEDRAGRRQQQGVEGSDQPHE